MLNKKTLILFLITLTFFSFGQYVLPNEEVIFSFDTQSGKKVTLNKDKGNKYMVYRFGTKNKVELEFSDKTKNSFKQFTYSFYMRGSGAQNDGMDLNYVSFTNANYKYVIYDTYYSVANRKEIGIKVIDLKTSQPQTVKGNYTSRKGTLINFRDNGLIGVDEILPE
ncbi:MAG: hypothetical protein ABIP51_22925 [Bacteroidia bacterium]